MSMSTNNTAVYARFKQRLVSWNTKTGYQLFLTPAAISDAYERCTVRSRLQSLAAMPRPGGKDALQRKGSVD